MLDNLRNFAEKKPFLWASIMGILSSFFLGLIALFQLNTESSDIYTDKSDQLIGLFASLVCFILLSIFFMCFTYFKNLNLLFRFTNTLTFAFVFFILLEYSLNNLEILNEKINFISVKQWYGTQDDISDSYTWFVLIFLAFINIITLNILPNKLINNKKILNYISISVLIIEILYVFFHLLYQ